MQPQSDMPDSFATRCPLPDWITAARPHSLEEAAFFSGAALAHLHLACAGASVPQALWRDRLALQAAEVCVGLSGRREDVVALRDALYLTRPGDSPGPAGEILQRWLRAVARPIAVGHLGRVLEGVSAEQIALCLDAKGGTAVDRAARVLEAVLTQAPRAEVVALILADAVLAKTLGWTHLVPLLSLGFGARDLRLRGDALRLACHQALITGAKKAMRLGAELARAAARLRAVAPKLRAKLAGRAVEMFLSQDALLPGALTPFMSDRAARRLCGRLVSLGVLRELTGRDSFRLYGV